MTTHSDAWTRINKLGTRFAGDECRVCGHQTGLRGCIPAADVDALDQRFHHALDELHRKLPARGFDQALDEMAALGVSEKMIDEARRKAP